MSAFTTYIMFTAESLGVCIILMGVGGLVAMTIPKFFQAMESRTTPWNKLAVWSFCLLIVVGSLLPDRKTVMAMMVVPYVTQNEQISQLPENVAAALNRLLQEYATKTK